MICKACCEGRCQDCRGGTWCDAAHRDPLAEFAEKQKKLLEGRFAYSPPATMPEKEEEWATTP